MFPAEHLYQPKDDGKTASVYQFPNLMSRLQQTTTTLQSQRRPPCTNALAAIESSCAAKAFRLPQTKLYSTSPRISTRIIHPSKITPSPLSSFQKPHSRPTWQAASLISFPGTRPRTSRNTVEHTELVRLLSTVGLVTSDIVAIAPLISTKAILYCHPIWKLAKQRRNCISHPSNWHLPWIKFSRKSRSVDSASQTTQLAQLKNQFLRVFK